MQRVCAPLGEVRTEAVSTNVLHLMLVGQRGNGALRILFCELFPQEDEVGEAAADGEFGLLEGLVVRLQVCERQSGCVEGQYRAQKDVVPL